jgi:hypothetical protein
LRTVIQQKFPDKQGKRGNFWNFAARYAAGPLKNTVLVGAFSAQEAIP